MEILLLDPKHLLNPGIIQVKAANRKIGNGCLYQSLPELGSGFLYRLQQIFVDDNMRRGNQYPLSSLSVRTSSKCLDVRARGIAYVQIRWGTGVLAVRGEEVADIYIRGERCPVSWRNGLEETRKRTI